VLVTAVYGHLGPLTLEDLLIPVLFYASCYIAAASLLVFISYVAKDELPGQLLGECGRTGSAAILIVAIVVALVVTGVIPILAALSDATSGWIIVGAQLIAVAPVTLFSLGTLRHGKVDDVVTRALVYVLVLGLIFLAFVGGLTLMESMLANSGNSRVILEGLYVVFLLIFFERFARKLRVFASSFFSTERHKARQKLTRFQAEMTNILDVELLAQTTINVIGKVFKAKSAILFLPSASGKGGWVTGRYHPEAPYLTERIFHTVWPHFKDHPTIWARNPELNENFLPDEWSALLEDHHAALAIPIRQEGEARGLLVLGRKSPRRSVYNLDDLEQMLSLSSQLALAVERLAFIERERQLAKESTNAHLVALRAQINPHFLFNALNTILALIEERPDEAEGVVEDLADIFRHTLTTGSQPFVSLEEEFKLVDCYLKIEQARFGDRLRVECFLDPDVANVPVPAFAVQTIVENAIKHGLEKQRKQGKLSVSCTRFNEDFSRVVVKDSGVGIPSLFGEDKPAEGIASFFGIGLTNVASRLERHYGRRDLLKFESDSESGTTVTLLIPEDNQAPIIDPD
ncbi:MAG: GAF domain-containing protein, partial [Bacteroidetes bacterium]